MGQRGIPGEARRYYRPRVKHRWAVEVELVAEPAPAPSAAVAERLRTWTHGVSIGGAFIESEFAPDVGTGLHVWLYPSDGESGLRLRAEVRWHNGGQRRDLPRGFGIAFRALTAADEVTLHGYFARAATPGRHVV